MSLWFFLDIFFKSYSFILWFFRIACIAHVVPNLTAPLIRLSPIPHFFASYDFFIYPIIFSHLKSNKKDITIEYSTAMSHSYSRLTFYSPSSFASCTFAHLALFIFAMYKYTLFVKQNQLQVHVFIQRIFLASDSQHYKKIGKEAKCNEDETPVEIPDSREWCGLGCV